MTRKNLKKLGDKERHRFIGVVGKFGWKSGWNYPEKTIMLRDIKLFSTDEILTDHLWFNLGKQFASLNLKEGDVVSFDARVGRYVKGYMGDDYYFFTQNGYFPQPPRVDYKLRMPTKIRLEN